MCQSHDGIAMHVDSLSPSCLNDSELATGGQIGRVEMGLRPNRYDELTAEQRADIDGVVNAIASGREDATTVSYRDYVQECRALAEQAAELVADVERFLS